ncbi:MAG: DUF4443 domain-containing protein [Thaumarchaeota archaeon]|nr:DUF4443 domain-containing protein [Nitrososphaerota archaeon]
MHIKAEFDSIPFGDGKEMNLRLAPILEKVVETTVGPSPTFSKLHVYKAITLLGNKTLGRNALAKELGIGSGAIRTLIARLRAVGMIKVESNGCKLTRRGQTVREKMIKRIAVSQTMHVGRMSLGKFDHAVLVKTASTIVSSPIVQRDAAIVQGAKGATTIIFKNGKFALPGDTADCEKDYPDEVWKLLRQKLKPQNNDVIIITSAENVQKAEYGALAAAWTLIP